jgi:hypothetical protein
MIYLSGCVNRFRHERLGFLITPVSNYSVPQDTLVAADNACFSQSGSYSDERYEKFLRRMPANRTLFAVAPDMLGDHEATVKRSRPMLQRLRDLGFKSAFVAQDGWNEKTTPWDEFDVLFVGGSIEFKYRGGRMAVAAAKRRGKKAHMGRVNSLDKLRSAVAIGCDTADGTFLRYGPDSNWPRLKAWLDDIHRQGNLQDHPG